MVVVGGSSLYGTAVEIQVRMRSDYSDLGNLLVELVREQEGVHCSP